MIRKYFNQLCLCGIGLLSITSCSKDDSAPADSNNFSPLTANSTWTYQSNNTNTFTLTATNRDTTANGKTYRVLTNTAGANNYMRKEGNDYYRFGSVAELNLSAAEELYLKGDLPINGTWTASQNITVPGSTSTIPVTMTYTIKGKALSRTVAGKAFNNVTYVRLDLSVPLLGSLGGGDFYYAEGVGLIESSLLVNVPGQTPLAQSVVLTNYSIK